MVFGRRRRGGRDGQVPDAPGSPDGTGDTADTTADTTGDTAGDTAGAAADTFVDDLDEEDRAYEDALLLAEIDERERSVAGRPQGPWDAADAPEDGLARVDLGGLLVPVPEATQVRVDVEEQVVTAATLVSGTSAVQVTAFAAPRTEGIWDEVRGEIAASVTGSGGRTEEVDGPYGAELRALVPTPAPDGRGIVFASTRFVGVDGPRWFLRAMYTGPAATDPAEAAPLEEALRSVVVVRGADPMAVRDPLPLRMPPQARPAGEAAPASDERTGEASDEVSGGDPLGLPGRGPEVTETR